jgi:hypothetical protein
LDILRSISDFYFWGIFEKKLLYAYMENTLNGEIGTTCVIIIRLKKFVRFFLSALNGMV